MGNKHKVQILLSTSNRLDKKKEKKKRDTSEAAKPNQNF